MDAAFWALIVSLFSVFATLWGVFVIQRRNMVTAQKQLAIAEQQLESARVHNRLSFKPFLIIIRSYEIDASDRHLMTVSLLIYNNGIGPALIKSLQVYIDGRLQKIDQPDIWHHVFEHFGIKTLNNSITTRVVTKDYCMAARETVNLIKGIVSTASQDQIEAAFARCRMVVEFESFYEERYEYDTARHVGEKPTIISLK